METKKVVCPDCGTGLKVAQSLPPGKAIKCPKCSSDFPVPEDEEELVAEPVVTSRKRKPSRPPAEEEDWDEEEASRPASRKKPRKKKKSATSLILFGGLGLLAVFVLSAGLTYAFFPVSSSKKT